MAGSGQCHLDLLRRMGVRVKHTPDQRGFLRIEYLILPEVRTVSKEVPTDRVDWLAVIGHETQRQIGGVRKGGTTGVLTVRRILRAAAIIVDTAARCALTWIAWSICEVGEGRIHERGGAGKGQVVRYERAEVQLQSLCFQ